MTERQSEGRPRRGRTAAIAASCLIAGVAIGFAVPRPGAIAPPGRSGADGVAGTGAVPGLRKVYSPVILADPYVRARHLEAVAILEQQCRATGKDCPLAAAARRAVSEQK